MAVPPHDASTLEVLDPLAEATGLRDPVPATAASAADPASACAPAPPASAAAAAPASSAVSAAAAAADGDRLSGPRGGGAAVTTTGWPLSGFNERTKVNVAEQHGTRTSVVWRFFAKFSPALDDGKNAKCTLMKDDGTECKAVYKHDNEANTGTGSMVRHLRRTKDASHKQAIKEFDAESKLSGAAKGARGAALGGAVKGEERRRACKDIYFEPVFFAGLVHCCTLSPLHIAAGACWSLLGLHRPCRYIIRINTFLILLRWCW